MADPGFFKTGSRSGKKGLRHHKINFFKEKNQIGDEKMGATDPVALPLDPLVQYDSRQTIQLIYLLAVMEDIFVNSSLASFSFP